MNVKLDSLIEKIKADGVDAAKKQAEEIIAAANEDADEIIKKAKNKAAQYEKNAESEAKSYQKNAEIAIKQAARDTVLVLKEKITAILEQALLTDIDKTMDKDFLKDLIVKIAGVWAKDGDVEVLVNGMDVDALMAELKSALGNSVKSTIEVKLDRKISKGFRIGKKGDNLFYDFTDESILEALRIFLNPKLAEILK
jgi:V/A-type H+/Na+-transporting ATPase subunit E